MSHPGNESFFRESNLKPFRFSPYGDHRQIFVFWLFMKVNETKKRMQNPRSRLSWTRFCLTTNSLKHTIHKNNTLSPEQFQLSISCADFFTGRKLIHGTYLKPTRQLTLAKIPIFRITCNQLSCDIVFKVSKAS